MVEQLLQYTRGIALKLGRGILLRSFVRHVGVLTLANGVSAVLSFVQGILVARWLGPELYGVAALVMSIPALLYTFFDARSAEALVKFLSEFHARGERERAVALCHLGYLIDLAMATLAFIGVMALGPWASRTIVHRPELGWLLIVYAAAFLPRSLQGTSYAVLAVHARFPTVALINTVTTLVRVALVLGFVLAGWSVTGVVLGNAVAMVLTGLFYAFAAWPLIHTSWGRISCSATWANLKGYRREIIRFLAYNDLTALLGMIPKQLDVVLLGYFRDPTEVGFYKLAKSIAGMAGYLVAPLQSVAYPELARLWGTRNMHALRQKVRKMAFRIGLPLGLIAAVGTMLVPFIVPPLVGNAYRPAMPSIELLFLSSVVSLAFFWLRPLFMAEGRVHPWFFITLTVVVCFAVVSPPAIWEWGYIGLSASWLGIVLLGHSLALYHLLRQGRIG